jgi:hypothetical protein
MTFGVHVFYIPLRWTEADLKNVMERSLRVSVGSVTIKKEVANGDRFTCGLVTFKNKGDYESALRKCSEGLDYSSLSLGDEKGRLRVRPVTGNVYILFCSALFFNISVV